jgi:hypothetical protein
VDAQHHGVRVVEAREVIDMIKVHSAAASAAPEQGSGIVWVGIKFARKGYPLSGASIHSASGDDYKAYLKGQGAFEGEREVIGFVSSSQVKTLWMLQLW